MPNADLATIVRDRLLFPLLDSLACYRLARLISADSITAPWRDALIARAYERAGHDLHFADEKNQVTSTPPEGWTKFTLNDDYAPRLAEAITCRFCASVWAAGFIVAARRLAPKAWDPLSRVLALSAVGALLAGLEDD